jgi:UDP-N-acetylglucosamine 1-carboxyvinyltransferase
MGARIVLNENEAKIFGTGFLSGATVKAHDLRAGAAMILAGLAASGRTVVLDEKRCVGRGYLNFAGKLHSLGACIREED